MESIREQRSIRLYFTVSVALKGLISLAEVVAGVAALFVPVSWVSDYLVNTVAAELGETSDTLAALLIHTAQQLSVTSGVFIAVYLLSRGLIKLLLVVALLRDQLWAYPSSLLLIGAFVAYQCYQFAIGHSVLIALLTLFDLVVMYFIWREWQILKELHRKSR